MCCWVSKNTELEFVSFSSGQFTRMAVVKPKDKKLVNSTSVHWIWWDTLDMYVKAVAPYSTSNIACLVLGIDRFSRRLCNYYLVLINYYYIIIMIQIVDKFQIDKSALKF